MAASTSTSSDSRLCPPDSSEGVEAGPPRNNNSSGIMFSQRIVNMDFYSAFPSPEFDVVSSSSHSAEVKVRVPVLRIYGSTPGGQKTCTHIHGVFPYLSILYASDIDDFEEKVKEEVDKAMDEYLNMNNKNFKTANGPRRHVFEVVKMLGRTYYGYRHADELFLRIYFYNPLVIRKVADLLMSGSILGRKFQPYDAHISYQLQFMIDYNLYGMNLVHFTNVKFRRVNRNEGRSRGVAERGRERGSLPTLTTKGPESGSSGTFSGVSTVWNISDLQDSNFSKSVEKFTRTELEVDVLASDILVVYNKTKARSSNPGIDAIWQDEMERRRQLRAEGMSQISIPDSQSRDAFSDLDQEVMHKQILRQKLEDMTLEENEIGLDVSKILDESIHYNAVPASQIKDHMMNRTCLSISGSYSDESFIKNHEEDELYDIFKDLIKENEEDDCKSKQEREMEEDLRVPDIPEEEGLVEMDGEDESDHVSKTEWTQSFLSNTILDALLNEDFSDEDENTEGDVRDQTTPKSSRGKAKSTIFQGDGQGDSESDEESGVESSQASVSSNASRRSSRARRTPAKYKDSFVKIDPKKRGKKHTEITKLQTEQSSSGAEAVWASNSVPPQTTSRQNPVSRAEFTRLPIEFQTIVLNQPVILLEQMSITPSSFSKRIKEAILTAQSQSKKQSTTGIATSKEKTASPMPSDVEEKSTKTSRKSKQNVGLKPDRISVDKIPVIDIEDPPTKDAVDISQQTMTKFTAGDDLFTPKTLSTKHPKQEPTIHSIQNEGKRSTSRLNTSRRSSSLSSITRKRRKSQHVSVQTDDEDDVIEIERASQNSRSSQSSRSIEVQTEAELLTCLNCSGTCVSNPCKQESDVPEIKDLPGSNDAVPETNLLFQRLKAEKVATNARVDDLNTRELFASNDVSEAGETECKTRLTGNAQQQRSAQSSSPRKKQRSPPRTPRINLQTPTTQERETSPHKRYKSLFKRVLLKNQKNHVVKLSPSFVTLEDSINFDSADQPKVSCFQTKRSASRLKSRKRRMMQKAKQLVANFAAPDVSRHEFEPLKQPPSFKHLMKRAKRKRNQESTNRKLRNQTRRTNSGDVSSREGSPRKVVRRYNIGGTSDDESNSDADISKNEVSFRVTPTSSCASVASSSKVTPNSILRKPSSKTAREMGASGKRKIRWNDDTPKSSKSRKTEDSMDLNELTTLLNGPVVNNSELDGPSPKNGFGFEHDMSNLHDAKALHQHQYVTMMSMELFCENRKNFVPDPMNDKIKGIFVYVKSDYPEDFSRQSHIRKNFFLSSIVQKRRDTDPEQECYFYLSELDMLQAFLRFYHSLDPDILIGYEIEKCSWGYLVGRGTVLGIDMVEQLSRLNPLKKRLDSTRPALDPKRWEGEICGRIVLNLWKLLRHEMAVQSYTYENASYHILHRRVFRFNYATLTRMWHHAAGRSRVIQYYRARCKGSIEIIEKLDLINRTSELARLFGILFYEVLSRGSQFRVESMMLRITKAQNLIPPSPSIMQRSRMQAPEFLPLILEPISSYYTDPVAVLDFQSLYPSMIIAYNYDYATILGRVEHLGRSGRFEMGCVDNEIPIHVLKKLVAMDAIHVSPAGVAFVKPNVRKGILSEMLEQILDTRQMVKRAMKKWKNEGPTLQKILDSRQLGLKLIANVTYGYTSANFSGRMPCIEIADSVVSKGRETLQRAVDHVRQNFEKWGGEVIYGDTDSVFIRFRGKTRLEAFKCGREIADEITFLNPKPVKLKFEKIYQPCILQSKKRYVGYSYESEDQVDPIYDAKGIETVRRDGCPAVQKILQKTLHILFTTNDPEKVRHFVELQFKRLFQGRVSLSDYIFAKQYRGRDGYKPAACVPALEIAKKLVQIDPRAEPLKKERVPYVIIYDKPSLPLIKMVRTPLEFVGDYSLRLNAHYYIEKAIIPALQRCLGLAKMNVAQWYTNLPRTYFKNFLEDKGVGHGTLDDFVYRYSCPRCNAKTEKGVCTECDGDIHTMTSYLVSTSSDLSKKLDTASQICVMCSGDDNKCENFDCPVFHKLLRYEKDEQYNRQLLSRLNTLNF